MKHSPLILNLACAAISSWTTLALAAPATPPPAPPKNQPAPPKNQPAPIPPAAPLPPAVQPPAAGGGGALTIELPEEVRSPDGSGNNVANPTQGTPFTSMIRISPAAYADGTNAPSGNNRPSARAISNAVATQSGSVPNKVWATDFLWQWGQFLDHDLDLTLTANPAEAFDIPVPAGDAEFDPANTGTKVIPLSRSLHEEASGIRQQVNAITAYIDASQVYGSDETRATALRRLDGSGKLKTSASDHGDLLPYNEAGLPNAPDGNMFFLAGDLRVNEQVGLIAIQTLFAREHNTWAERYAAVNADATDEEIYQFARMVVAAEIQRITYHEFLPILLGPNALPPYRGYKSGVNASVSNEFATAAYRLGHSLLSPTLKRLDASGKTIANGDLSLRDSFFNLAPVETDGIDPILRGLATQICQDVDGLIIDDVRNFLFGAPGSGGFDLASLNIQRGRDHGLGTLNQTRKALGLRPAKTFAEINPDKKVAARLAAAYATPDQVDLWIGGLCEADVPGAMVGPTFHRILVDQFLRTRDGDRFWYQNYLPADMIRLVEGQTLGKIITRNTKIGKELQPNVWFNPPAKPPVKAPAKPVVKR